MDSNASETLLDDFDDENVPPNFVPETPVVGKQFVIKGRPSLSDLSFVPDSQSSPLPTSAVAIMKNQSQFKIPDSPCSDLNEKKKDGGEAQEAASDQKTETTETSASGREESINDKSDDNYKEVVEETKSEPVSVSAEKVDKPESSASESS